MLKFNASMTILTLTCLCNAQVPQDSIKGSYHLFHATPGTLMRSLETDRPDVTESAYTVDAGHFQYETDLFKSDHSTIEGIKTIHNLYNAFNLKAGITNSLDLQFVFESFVTEKVIKNGETKQESGIGNITLRAKQNLWGNDHGKSAMAIIPFINIPTSSKSKVTAGAILPFTLTLSNDWSFGSEVGVDLENNQSGKGYHINLLASATVGHPLFRNISFFAESLISRETELKSCEYFLNTGMVYEWHESLEFDAGIYYGIKDTSSKIYFIGLSYRY
jgi:Putative MetA-pathway of phenol degradation